MTGHPVRGLLTASGLAFSIRRQPPGVFMLTQVLPAQFQQWLASYAENGIKPVVLDVREPWEIAQASIQPGEGFELRCIPMHDIPARLQELDPDHPIACLCHHGARSMSVAAFLVN